MRTRGYHIQVGPVRQARHLPTWKQRSHRGPDTEARGIDILAPEAMVIDLP